GAGPACAGDKPRLRPALRPDAWLLGTCTNLGNYPLTVEECGTMNSEMAGNRKQPKRGSASESRYSLMEFMREFPDDEACLSYLWRTRYAPDGSHARCPRCEVKRAFQRYETGQQR